MIIIYSMENCGYCAAAKSLLKERGFEYEEVMLDNPEAIAQFKERCPGETTVPQIWWHWELLPGGYQGLRESFKLP